MLLHQTAIVTILNKALNQFARIRKGTDAVYHCPVCHHYKRKLEINLNTGKYHCWVCGLSGTSLKTLFKKLNLPYHLLSEIYKNSQFLKRVPPSDLDLIVQLFDVGRPLPEPIFLPKEYKSFFDDSINLVGKHALNYLKKRGVTKNND